VTASIFAWIGPPYASEPWRIFEVKD
jgi:hypothetical protein